MKETKFKYIQSDTEKINLLPVDRIFIEIAYQLKRMNDMKANKNE